MARGLRRLGALPPRERNTLLLCSALLPVFWLGVRVLGLVRFQSLLERGSRHVRRPATDEIKQMSRLVHTASRLAAFMGTCLTRTLLLDWLLRQRGIVCDLRIGVRLAQGKLEAHAWLEYEGVPVNDKADVAREFAPFHRRVSDRAFHNP